LFSDSYESIGEIFGLCEAPANAGEVEALIGTVSGALGTMAMVDYPYPTSFVTPLPAWPVNQACSDAAEAKVAHKDD